MLKTGLPSVRHRRRSRLVAFCLFRMLIVLAIPLLDSVVVHLLDSIAKVIVMHPPLGCSVVLLAMTVMIVGLPPLGRTIVLHAVIVLIVVHPPLGCVIVLQIMATTLVCMMMIVEHPPLGCNVGLLHHHARHMHRQDPSREWCGCPLLELTPTGLVGYVFLYFLICLHVFQVHEFSFVN